MTFYCLTITQTKKLVNFIIKGLFTVLQSIGA